MFFVRTTPHTHKGDRRRSTSRLAALLLLLPILAVLGAQASPAAATSELCEGDVVEVQGEIKTIPYTAPDGYLVSSWCVKSGTEAEVHEVNPPAKTITIAHTSGKGISHYSVTLVKAPEPKAPAAATALDVCEPATGPTNDRIMIPTDANFTYTVDGVAVAAGSFVATGTTHTVVAVPKAGVVVAQGATTQWTFTFTKVLCVTPPTPVAPAAATALDVCEPATGPTNDRIMIPTDANFTYTVDGVAVAAGSFVATGTTHTVVAVPKAGVVVAQGATTQWTFTFTKVLCVTPPPPVVTPPVVTPPVVTPPVVTPPVVAPPEVLPEQAFGKAVGAVKASCQGTVRARLSNRSGRTVTYKLRVGTKVHRIAVRSLASKKYVTQGRAHARVVLKVNGTRLDQTRIPAHCQAPEVLPDTGLRATSS